jgi:DUF4097 and DUF4098 domain-containing protein YvlB
MKRHVLIRSILILLALGAQWAMGQDDVVDRLSVPFSNPNQPGLVEVGLVNGSISVTGYDGTEVIVEARTRMRKISSGESEKVQGMIRIPVTTTGLTVEEDNNVMEIETESWKRTIDLDIRVPTNTSLNLSTVNHGDIQVQNVRGEIDVNNVNGKVTLLDISGAVVAHALNKDLIVTMDDVFPDKAMSFSTLNGDIDVVFPANLKANVNLKADNGDIYSDFEIQLSREPKKVVEENTRSTGGKYKVRVERSIHGTINGGGPEILFKSFQGDIFIRKEK